MAIVIINIRIFQNIGFLLCFSCASSSLVLFLFFLTNLRISHWEPVYLYGTHEQVCDGPHVPPFKQGGSQTAVKNNPTRLTYL